METPEINNKQPLTVNKELFQIDFHESTFVDDKVRFLIYLNQITSPLTFSKQLLALLWRQGKKSYF